MSAVMLYLDLKPRAVLALIESGKLRWAFDIRSESASARTVRVLRESLFEYTRLRPREKFYASEELEFAELVKGVLPERQEKKTGAALRTSSPFAKGRVPTEPALRGTEVARCFSCSASHINRLAREKTLRALNCPRRAKAPLLISRSSVIDFLRRRRIT